MMIMMIVAHRVFCHLILARGIILIPIRGQTGSINVNENKRSNVFLAFQNNSES